jgi:hypothetical protein
LPIANKNRNLPECVYLSLRYRMGVSILKLSQMSIKRLFYKRSR